MNRLRRIAAGTTIVAVIGTAGLAGGTAQAHAGPWNWVCSKIGNYIGPMGCR